MACQKFLCFLHEEGIGFHARACSSMRLTLSCFVQDSAPSISITEAAMIVHLLAICDMDLIVVILVTFMK